MGRVLFSPRPLIEAFGDYLLISPSHCIFSNKFVISPQRSGSTLAGWIRLVRISKRLNGLALLQFERLIKEYKIWKRIVTGLSKSTRLSNVNNTTFHSSATGRFLLPLIPLTKPLATTPAVALPLSVIVTHWGPLRRRAVVARPGLSVTNDRLLNWTTHRENGGHVRYSRGRGSQNAVPNHAPFSSLVSLLSLFASLFAFYAHLSCTPISALLSPPAN